VLDASPGFGRCFLDAAGFEQRQEEEALCKLAAKEGGNLDNDVGIVVLLAGGASRKEPTCDFKSSKVEKESRFAEASQNGPAASPLRHRR
jgi:hypothetical protein